MEEAGVEVLLLQGGRGQLGSHGLFLAPPDVEQRRDEAGARLVVRPLSLLCFLEDLHAGLEQRLSWTTGAWVSEGWAPAGEGRGSTATQ